MPLILAFVWTMKASGEVVDTDICVFGGTSSGVIAAVQAKRMGKTVALAEPYVHLGGMTASGLGATDIGTRDSVGGLAHEFYNRVAKYYANDAAWTAETKDNYFTKHANHLSRQSDLTSPDGVMLTFEPHVAEGIFAGMLKEASITAHLSEKLASVTKDGPRIVEITMENGDVFRAREFIDATYEGDLMAKAKVSYTVGRESGDTYKESLAGVRFVRSPFEVPVDPYVKPGDPSSGLLPLVQSDAYGNLGEADKAVQAYNYRLCLTSDPANQIEIAPPADYHPETYEILARYYAAFAPAGKKPSNGLPCWAVPMPNDKLDLNNSGPISTDFIGMNKDYPDADYATREKIAKAHENYIRGWFTFLRTSTAVPDGVRKEAARWGLCKDEFKDSAGWPFQLYVREARRMVSTFVMKEENCIAENARVKDSIGMGSYPLDCHYCRRVVLNGKVEDEGTLGPSGISPFPIPYRALVPKPQECTNLLVPVCLSASHVAYAPIRMEPVYMILGQSAATAAALAIDGNVSVQALDYTKLRSRLEADGQILDGHWIPGKTSSAP